MTEKMGDMLGRFGKRPSGLGLGLKLLAGAVSLGYVATRSVYTGTFVMFKASQLITQRQQVSLRDGQSADEKPPLDEVSQKLMSFFEIPDNWGKDEVASGRAWGMNELRIKSNDDLHKLWFILYKERNMLLTMEEAAKEEVENLPSPERIDKVEESMKNIEEVVKERNKAYYQLEVGDDQYVERRRVFRKDVFGRYRWIASSEHLIPYWMNNSFRAVKGPGFGSHVHSFNRKLREKKFNQRMALIQRQKYHVRQLLKRFPNIDLDYLKEIYPDVDVDAMKTNLDEYCLEDRVFPFNDLFYESQKKKL